MYSATQNQIKLDPAENPSGTWQLMAAPISYSELYGSTKTFTTNDELVILDSSTIAHTTQFTQQLMMTTFRLRKSRQLRVIQLLKQTQSQMQMN